MPLPGLSAAAASPTRTSSHAGLGNQPPLILLWPGVRMHGAWNPFIKSASLPLAKRHFWLLDPSCQG